MLKTKATSRDKSNYKSTDRFQSHHLCRCSVVAGTAQAETDFPSCSCRSCRSPLSFPVGFAQFPSCCSWVSSWMLQGPQNQLNSVFMLCAANGIYCHLVPYHSNPRESSSEFPALPLVPFSCEYYSNTSSYNFT